jgi:hypothetical protein
MDDAFELSINNSEFYYSNEAGTLSLLTILEPIFSSYLGPFSVVSKNLLSLPPLIKIHDEYLLSQRGGH